MSVKICSRCKESKPYNCFSKNKAKKSGLNTACKDCMKTYLRSHYRENKERYLEDNKERRRKNKDWFSALKSTLFCSKCGENHPATLDFHHTDPSKKEGGIGVMVHSMWSIEKIEEEISKCIVLCSNCHRKLHYEEDRDISID